MIHSNPDVANSTTWCRRSATASTPALGVTRRGCEDVSRSERPRRCSWAALIGLTTSRPMFAKVLHRCPRRLCKYNKVKLLTDCVQRRQTNPQRNVESTQGWAVIKAACGWWDDGGPLKVLLSKVSGLARWRLFPRAGSKTARTGWIKLRHDWIRK